MALGRLGENSEELVLGCLFFVGRSVRRVTGHFLLFPFEKKWTRLEVVGFDAKRRLFDGRELVVVILENGQEVLGSALAIDLEEVPVLLIQP